MGLATPKVPRSLPSTSMGTEMEPSILVSLAAGLATPEASVCRLQTCTGCMRSAAMPAMPLPMGIIRTLSRMEGGMPRRARSLSMPVAGSNVWMVPTGHWKASSNNAKAASMEESESPPASSEERMEFNKAVEVKVADISWFSGPGVCVPPATAVPVRGIKYKYRRGDGRLCGRRVVAGAYFV